MVDAPLASSHWHADSPTRFPRSTDFPGSADDFPGSTVGGVLRAAVARVPDRTALVFGDRQWSYRDLLADAVGGARALLASFIPGDVVAVWAENSAQWVALEFAAGLAGLNLLPVDPSAGAEEVSYVLAHSGARGIFTGTDRPDSGRVAVIRSVENRLPALWFVISLPEWDALCAIGSVTGASLPEVDPDSPAQILYTAGTAGRPKAALLTHRGLTGNARLAAGALGCRDGEVVVNSLPLSRATGCGLATLGTAQFDGTHVLAPRSDAAAPLALAGKHRGGLLCVEPAALPALVTDPSLASRDLSSLRAVVSGGAPLRPELALEAETALGVPVLTGLCQTEAGGLVTATSARDSLADRLGGVGRPLPGTEVKVTGLGTGETLPCGEIGEFQVRGCQVMRGYLDDPRLTARVLDGDGWLRTGDLGAMDSRGYCRVVGRVHELIVRGGQHVYPREVEAVLCGHPAVAEAAIMGVPDRFWGEAVAAMVRLAGPLEAPALTLTEYCGGRLAPFKVPVRWLFVDGFPRTAHGEVRKSALSTLLADATEPDWQSWKEQTPSDLGEIFGSRRNEPPDLSGPFADLLDLQVPPQERRSKALEF